MARYEYSGRDTSGSRVSGAIDARDLKSAANQLAASGVIPLELKPGRSNRDKPGLLQQLGLDRPGKEDLIMFARQMHSLTRAGVPLNRGLSFLAESSRSPALGRAIRDISNDLEAGRDLATALARHPRIFNPLFIAMVEVGETSGRLDEAFERIYQYMQRDKTTARQVQKAVRYPTFVVVAMIVAIAILMTVVIPVFAGIFASMGETLPFATRVIIAMSDFFVNYWRWMLAFSVGGIVAFQAWKRTPDGRLRWDHARLAIPVMGSIQLRASLARFGRSFVMAYRSGVPILETLQVSAQAVDNAHLTRKILEMRSGIEHGEALSRTAAKADIFTPLVLQMLVIGEETGNLDEMLSEVAEFYEREVDYDVENLSALIEPIMTAGLAALVLLLALGIFLPMWELSSAMT